MKYVFQQQWNKIRTQKKEGNLVSSQIHANLRNTFINNQGIKKKSQGKLGNTLK